MIQTQDRVPLQAAQGSAARPYSFRDLVEADLPILQTWLGADHVREWWGDPDEALAEILEAMGDPATRPMIVELEGEPIAYLQTYDPHKETRHPYRDQPEGTLGLDLSIGPADRLGSGHGSAILRRYSDQLFEQGVLRLIIDPDPKNIRAIRAYEKAGFVAFDRRTSIYGPALMMARDA